MMIRIVLAALCLAYALSPYDALPDFFAGLGWIDDIIVLILGWKLFQYLSRRRGINESRSGEYNHTSSGRTKDDRFSGNGAFGSGGSSRDQVKRDDPYDVLGVNKSASPDEIKTAYKRLATKYHPDKVAHLGEEFRALAEQRFKEIQKAYQELQDN
jgi:DnaJ like chaperone protein